MKITRIHSSIASALLVATALTACGSDSDSTATTVAATATADSAVAVTGSGADGTSTVDSNPASNTVPEGDQPGEGGPGGFGKNVDATQITTVEDVNALINEAYGDGSLGLHRGHQPVEQVLIDTLGISHDEMHVRMEEQGQNLSAIAEDLGVGTQTLIDALVDNWQPAIDNIESEGLIDADQATKYHEALVEAFTFKVNWNGTDEAPAFTGV